ncbi:hypothetical protein UUR4_0651 [Ureaplasma urealyticum serovar 4 str. ATCC 27816]|nr:hypothetical protein UUR4_0651 [Ureaplasma urealyticum serovar 4 str. ATCC 27816]
MDAAIAIFVIPPITEIAVLAIIVPNNTLFQIPNAPVISGINPP